MDSVKVLILAVIALALSLLVLYMVTYVIGVAWRKGRGSTVSLFLPESQIIDSELATEVKRGQASNS